jgi:hypothetical protein
MQFCANVLVHWAECGSNIAVSYCPLLIKEKPGVRDFTVITLQRDLKMDFSGIADHWLIYEMQVYKLYLKNL